MSIIRKSEKVQIARNLHESYDGPRVRKAVARRIERLDKVISRIVADATVLKKTISGEYPEVRADQPICLLLQEANNFYSVTLEMAALCVCPEKRKALNDLIHSARRQMVEGVKLGREHAKRSARRRVKGVAHA